MKEKHDAARRGIARAAGYVKHASEAAIGAGDDTVAAAFELMVASVTLMRCMYPGKDISEALAEISGNALAASEHFFKIVPDDGAEVFDAMIERAKMGFQS